MSRSSAVIFGFVFFITVSLIKSNNAATMCPALRTYGATFLTPYGQRISFETMTPSQVGDTFSMVCFSSERFQGGIFQCLANGGWSRLPLGCCAVGIYSEVWCYNQGRCVNGTCICPSGFSGTYCLNTDQSAGTSGLQTQPSTTRQQQIQTSNSNAGIVKTTTLMMATDTAGTTPAKALSSAVAPVVVLTKSQTTTKPQFTYRMNSQLKVKRIKLANRVRRQVAAATTVDNLFTTIIAANWSNDQAGPVYQAVKQAITDQIISIFTRSGFQVSPTDIDFKSLQPMLGEIVAEFINTAGSNSNQLNMDGVKSSVLNAIGQLKSEGALNTTFGYDGVNKYEIYELTLITNDDPSPPSTPPSALPQKNDPTTSTTTSSSDSTTKNTGYSSERFSSTPALAFYSTLMSIIVITIF